MLVTYGEYIALNCDINSPHESLYCTTVEGVGKDLQWLLTIGRQTSVDADGYSTYRAPVIFGVQGQGANEANTAGGQEIFVVGDNFGPSFASESLVVSYGVNGDSFLGEDCEITSPHDTIKCLTAEGTGKNHSWIVDVGSQASDMYAAGTSYAPPVVVQLTGAHNASTEGGQPVVIEGRQLGSVARNKVDNVTYGVTGVEFEAVNCDVSLDHTEISCLMDEGAGADHFWVVTIDGQKSKSPTTYYAEPVILDITGDGAVDALTEGGEEVHIIGENFGPYQSFIESVTYGPSGREYDAVDCVRSDDGDDNEGHRHIICKTR